MLDNYLRFVDEEEKSNLRSELADAFKYISALEKARFDSESYAKSLEVSLKQTTTYAHLLEDRLSHQSDI